MVAMYGNAIMASHSYINFMGAPQGHTSLGNSIALFTLIIEYDVDLKRII